MEKYPNYPQYLEFLRQRDVGMMFLALLVVCCVVMLIEARCLWPKLLPAARNGLVMLWYATLIIMTVKQVLGG